LLAVRLLKIGANSKINDTIQSAATVDVAALFRSDFRHWYYLRLGCERGRLLSPWDRNAKSRRISTLISSTGAVSDPMDLPGLHIRRRFFPRRETYLADNGTPLLRSLVFTAALFASAPGVASWSVENDRSTSSKHGLFEIRDEARRFISNENAKGLQQWEVLEPNLKTFVPRCVVPLKAQWTPKSFGLSRPSVMVICTAAIPNIAMGSWHVHVPVRQKRNLG